MGKTIEEGAVDGRLNVFGVSKLRVADASVFPVIPDGRIQNAVYMVAEKVITILFHNLSFRKKKTNSTICYSVQI